MKRIVAIAALIAAHSLGACATSAPAAPALDLSRVNQTRYQRDLAQCQTIASQAMGVQTGARTKTELVSQNAVRIAKAGVKTVARSGLNVVALAGGIGGEMNSSRGRVIVSNCLKGRGYRPLE